MVLKRLIVTTLGAFGMGALLAVGPVSAQQIPAPDAYGDPQACSAALAKLAKLKDPAPDEGEVGDNGLTPTQAANLRNMAQACSGDVGGGIAKARTLYQVAAAAQEALDEAQEAYDDDDSSRNERELEEAMEAHTEAMTARDLYSGGALIYEAVYEEEAALARADAASDVYDKAEGAAEKAKESTNEVKYENYIDKLAGFDSNGAPLEFEAVQVELIEDDPDTEADESVYKTFVRVKKQDGGYVAPVRETDANGDFLDTEGDVIEDPDEDSDYMYVFPDTIAATNDPDSSTLMVYDAEGNLATDTVDLELVTLDHDLDGDTDPMMWVVVDTDWTADSDTAVLDPVATSVVLTAEELTVLDAETMFRAEDPNDEEAEVGILVDYEAAKENLEEQVAELEANQDGLKTIELTEDVRKAQAVYDFFAGQKGDAEADLKAGKLKFDRVVDDEDTEGAVAVIEENGQLREATPDEITAGDGIEYAVLDDDFTTDDYEVIDELEDKRVDAADALKEAYDERVAASDDVEENLKSTEAYLDQLVGLREYEKELADVAAVDADEDDLDENGLTEDQVDANEALQTAEAQRDAHDDLQNRSAVVQNLVEALLEPEGEIGDDDGQALVDAIEETYQTASDALTAVEGLGGEDGLVAQNTAKNVEQDMKLMQKKEYIDKLAAEIGVDPVTGDGTEANGMSRIDNNETRSMANEAEIGMDENGMSRIDHNEYRSMANAAEIAVGDDGMSRIDHNETRSMGNEGAIEMLGGRVGVNETAISGLGTRIGANEANITDNRNRIGELSEALDIVRSGVAASMALAGMPAINGRGIAIGVGSFDGESAFAVGFQIQGEMASFQIGVTSSGGETGASAGVGFQF